MAWVVVGVEGRPSEDAAAFWGAAVVKVDGTILNPITGRRTQSEALGRLVDAGHVTLLEKPMEAGSRAEHTQLMVMLTRREHRFADLLAVDGTRLAGQVASQSMGNWHCRLFSSLEGLDQYADLVIGRLIGRLLGKQPPEVDVAEGMLELGSALDSSHPDLNAVRAHRAGDDASLRCYAARVRGDVGQQRFRAFFESLSDRSEAHHLMYRGGITRGGGMDVEPAIRVLEAYRKMGRQAAAELMAAHSCLRDDKPPTPRFHELDAAASARFVFRAVPGESELERVTRHLVLRRVRRYLAGDLPPEPKARETVAAAVHHLVTLDEGTALQHGAAEDHLEPVEESWQEVDVEPEAPPDCRMVLFGFVGGVLRRAKWSELYVSAKPSEAIKVSATDDGDGLPPPGVARDDHLWRAAIITLVRTTRDGRPTYYARRVTLLEDGAAATIDAIPSHVAAGAFLAGLALPLRREGPVIHVGDATIRLEPDATQEAAEEWYQRFADTCRELELALAAQPGPLTVVPPLAPPAASEAERLLDAVDAAGGASAPVPVDQVVDLARHRTPAAHRRNRNNILRPSEASKRSTSWFERDRAADTIQLTTTGRAQLRLFLEMGGQLPGRPASHTD